MRTGPLKTLGLLGGMSWESTAIYYAHLNRLAQARLGGVASAPLVAWSADFAEIAALQARGAWDEAGAIVAEAAARLEAAGAEAIVLCTNTMHRVAGQIEARIRVPLLHIADATAAAVKRSPSRRPLLLATRYTMEQPFYRGRLAERHGLEVVVPEAEDRDEVHRVIYEELCRGVVRPESRARFLAVVAAARAGAGADGVILGCTEVGLLLRQEDLDVPVFDTALLHAEHAFAFAAGDVAG